MQLRDATLADQQGILDIYNDAVLTTTSVWNETPRSLQEQHQWFESKRSQSLPVLVACEHERVAGFCSYGPFRAWYGYRFTVELSIYVASSHRRRGIARGLLNELIERATHQGLHSMIAGIEAQNAASIRLHEQAGFRTAGVLHEVGFKFDRWLDLLFMERVLRN